MEKYKEYHRVEEFLSDVRKMGIHLWVEEEKLKFKMPKGVDSTSILEELKKRKYEIIKVLGNAAVNNEVIARKNEAKRELSFAQNSLWIHSTMEGESAAYNITNGLKVSGNPDMDILQKALDGVVEKHESLRTVFAEEDGIPYQIIMEKVENLIEISDLTAEAESHGLLKAKIERESVRKFDMKKGPLFKVLFFKLDKEEGILVLNIHHIISDAFSNAVFIKELFENYTLLSEKKELINRELKVQFGDFAEWQRERLSKKEIYEPLQAFWKKKLENPTTIEMPCDFPRPKVQGYEGAVHRFTISEELSKGIRNRAAGEKASLFVTMLTALNILFYKYSGQEDIFIGSVVTDRTREELAGLIGFFVNTVVFRGKPSSEKSFEEFIGEIKSEVLDVYRHQELPFDKVIEAVKPERDQSRSPLFQVMMILQSDETIEINANGVKVELLDIINEMAPFDYRIQIIDSEKIEAVVHYKTSLFKKETIEKMGDHFIKVLEEIVKDKRKKIADINILSDKEKEELLYRFNNTKTDFQKDKACYEIIEQIAEKYPNKRALVFEGEELTYSELNKRGNSLAGFLRKSGIKADSTVGIMMDRSIEMVVSILAVQKAGGAYVPFDPNHPAERLAYMVENAGTQIMLMQERLKEKAKNVRSKIIYADTQWNEIAKESGENLDKIVTDSNLAYIIYTSGSTGKPKGAMNTHLGMRNHKQWMQIEYNLTSDDVVLQKTPFSFDVSVWEFFWPLMNGATLVVAKPEGHKDPEYLMSTIEREKITVIHFVPSMLHAFLNIENIKMAKSLRMVFSSGEALNLELINRFFEKYNLPLHNVYGPAECADVTTAWSCVKGHKGGIPIGKPISNTLVYILDRDKNLLPVGAAGEIYISGDGIGRGYINNSELTKERFIENNVDSRYGLMYKTGDIGKWLSDGNIEYLGRTDFQIKIRGFRIELGEIEEAVNSYIGVKYGVVSVWEKEKGDKKLVAYVEEDKGNKIDKKRLKKHIADKVPEYMVPSVIMILDKMPLNHNGKLDIKLLPEPVIEQGEYYEPQSDSERIVAEVWEKILKIDKIGVETSFFDVGGDSFKTLVMISELKKIGADIKVSDLYENNTIRELAALIDLKGFKMKAMQKQVTNKKYKIIDSVTPAYIKYPFEEVNCLYKPISIIQASFKKEYLDYFLLYLNLYMTYGIEGYFDNIFKQESEIPDEYFIKFFNDICQPKFGIRAVQNYFANEKEMNDKLMPAIDKEAPVLIGRDLFYVSYDERYKEDHHVHPIIVKGYNKNKELYNILEDIHSDSYKDFVVEFDKLYQTRFDRRDNEGGYFVSFEKTDIFENSTFGYDEIFHDVLRILESTEEFKCLEKEMINELELNKIPAKCAKAVAMTNFKNVFYDILFNVVEEREGFKEEIKELRELREEMIKESKKVLLYIFDCISMERWEFDNIRESIDTIIAQEKSMRKGIVKILKNITANKKTKTVREEKYEFVKRNNNNGDIIKDEKDIVMKLSGTKNHDIWTIKDNAPQLLIEAIKGEEIIFDVKADLSINRQSFGTQTGIIMRMSDGNKYLFGIDGSRVVVFCPEKGEAPEIAEKHYEGFQKYLRLCKKGSNISFLTKEKVESDWAELGEIKTNESIRNIGLFTRAINIECNVKFSDISLMINKTNHKPEFKD